MESKRMQYKRIQYKITANIIKATLCKYFRSKGNITVTEFCFDRLGWTDRADVMCFDLKKNEITEIEVKISKSDLRADIKKPKHKKTPLTNRFFYCVPFDLLDEAQEIVQAINPKYGIIAYFYPYRASCATGIDIRKSALLLKPKEPISDYIKETVMRRLSYENANLLLKNSKEAQGDVSSLGKK